MEIKFSTKCVIAIMENTVKITSGVSTKNIGIFIAVTEKSTGKNIIQTKNAVVISPRSADRIMLNGMLIFISRINPVMVVTITARVESCGAVKPKRLSKNTRITIFSTMVSPVGMDLLITLTTNFPRTISLFGSKAKINDGIPIVSVLISVRCIGSKG